MIPQDREALQETSGALRADMEVGFEAVQQGGAALAFASGALRTNSAVMALAGSAETQCARM